VEVVCSRDEAHGARGQALEVPVEIRWITTTGVKHLPEADLADTAARTDGVIWVHLDHSDEHGMALLVEMIDPRRDDLRDVNNRTPVPKLHIYPDHHYSAINGLARGSDGLLHFQALKTFLTPHAVDRLRTGQRDDVEGRRQPRSGHRP
jgi:hypothetical protein